MSLLMHATGMDVSETLILRRRDIDPVRLKVHARGTKNQYRDRIADIARCAWPEIKRHIRLLTSNALVFPLPADATRPMNRWTVSDKHRDACKRVGIEDYRLKDSRHTYSVRFVRAGGLLEVLARQLGHADTQMVTKV